MIYQIEIGSNDNAYIITGGLTGLTEFNPTIILGDDTGVRINVDSKNDDIFTPWIKQSMEISVVKSSEGEYANILAGDDNDTWGVLIENGYLYLSEGLITISDDAVVKFKGTLALESYSEEYKKTSIVSFTFHDRIGTLEDDIFYTNTQFKSVADILACCLSNVVCANTLYLEWPYTLSSSDDPTEILIDVEEFHGKKKIEVLEDVLHDFGMQLVVDFNAKPLSATLTSSGAVVVRSVTDIVASTVIYWNLSLSSFVSSTCGKEFFTYTGSKLAGKIKTKTLLDTITYPLINNEAVESLERVGSSIKAKNVLELKNSIIFRAQFSFDYAFQLGDGRGLSYSYCPFAKLSNIQEDCLNAIADLLNFNTSISDYDRPGAFKDGYGVLFSWFDGSPPDFNYYPTVGEPLYINADQFNEDGEMLFKTEVTCYNPDIQDATIRINPIILKKSTNDFYIHYSSSWHLLSNLSQLTSYNEHTITSETTETNTKKFTIESDGDDVVLIIALTSSFSISGISFGIIKSLQVSNTKLYPIEETSNIPSSINLTTVLSGNNRKVIEVESKIMSVPNIIGACYSLPYLIKDTSNKYPLTLDYKLLSQTLLAHLSDQYAWQYDGNRWNLDGSCTCFPLTQSFNLVGQFGLGTKILVFLNGDYDAKRKILKGKWGQVLTVGDSQYQLQKDNFEYFTWDNGNYIMLN